MFIHVFEFLAGQVSNDDIFGNQNLDYMPNLGN